MEILKEAQTIATKIIQEDKKLKKRENEVLKNEIKNMFKTRIEM